MKTEFKSWRSYWEFSASVKHQNRYIYNSDTKEFLDTVLATSENRKRTIPKDSYLWRAQIGREEHVEPDGDIIIIGLPYERMKPLSNMVTEGRANPKGIAYLYLADDKDTAMAEIRPWIGSSISLAQFKTMRDIVVVDCSSHDEAFHTYIKEPSPEKREAAVWSNINLAFSTPLIRTDQSAEYIPTQIIAELFKNNGADGIIYKSVLGEGSNFVLFDIESAAMINCTVYEANKLSFVFKQSSNPYFVKKYIEDQAKSNDGLK